MVNYDSSCPTKCKLSERRKPIDRNCPEILNVDIENPRYDQDFFFGRLRHFLSVTNPFNILASNAKLENAKCIVLMYRCDEPLPRCMTENELWRAKNLYDSAYHPDTKEKMPLFGRMSAQVPANTFITTMMITFCKSTAGTIFWQWFNQSFNALVNYTNRSGDTVYSKRQLTSAYLAATTGAVGTALGLNRLVNKASPLIGRFVPLAAVCVANCINVPCMRAQELKTGAAIYDENDIKLGNSKKAAHIGITKTIISRIAMAIPGMILTPIVMNYLERRGTICRYPWLSLPTQLGIMALSLSLLTPVGCAIFRQKQEMSYRRLEEELKCILDEKYGSRSPRYVYFNKGL